LRLVKAVYKMGRSDTYVNVVVDVPADFASNYLTYRAAGDVGDRIDVGHRVRVPLGKRTVEAYVCEVGVEAPEREIKDVIDISEPVPYLTRDIIETAWWISREYINLLPECLRCFVPPGVHARYRKLVVLSPGTGVDLAGLEKMAPVQARILRLLETAGGACEYQDIESELGRSCYQAIASLEDKDVVTVVEKWLDPTTKPRFETVYLPAADTDSLLEEQIAALKSTAPKQHLILKCMMDEPGVVWTKDRILDRATCSPAPLKSLVDRGFVKKSRVRVERDPLAACESEPAPPDLRLNQHQTEALAAIVGALNRGEHEVFLLHGVTGSGKTEVYLRAAQEVLKRGRQVIVLIPEIALTPQTTERFAGRFGERVAVMHSRLSSGERYDQWRRIRNREVGVVVGARSAVFAPVMDLGLVIVDEEHEGAYKQETSPVYHARDVAIERARRASVPVVLGSATPSIESFYQTQLRRYTLLSMPERVLGRPMPAVHLVDMRAELKAGNRSMLSRLLQDEIVKTLEENRRVVLFLNRRGYSLFVLCRECGHVIRCPDCDVSLTYHNTRRSGVLLCHYCGFKAGMPSLCPNCGSRYLRCFGAGTQQLEQVVRAEFPEARTGRMDSDTTTRKGAHEGILRDFRKGRIDVLIGTQMIAKGLDIPEIGLVGVVAADVSLNLPDFRAAERTFQLLTQVSGRTGRGEKPGLVIVQTYTPRHYSIQAAVRHDYREFYRQEIEFRRRRGYPPFRVLGRVLITGEKKNAVKKAAQALGMRGAEVLEKRQMPAVVRAPMPAPLSRIRGRYRWHMLIEGGSHDAVRDVSRYLLDQWRNHLRVDGVSIKVDIEPQSVL